MLKLKYFLDLFFAFVLSVILIPIFIILSIILLIFMGKPIIFKQKRIGENEKSFYVFKFRTMIDGAEPDNERLTAIGKLMRKLSLDELPQLLNIIKGEMSFIGPRPLPDFYLPYYSEREKIRHTIRPGITGLAQVNGRNMISWNERLSLDVEYVLNWSFQLDLKILIKTIEVLVSGRGVNKNQNMTMNRLDDERKKV